MNVEIIVNDLIGRESVILNNHANNEEAVFICVRNDDHQDYHVAVCIEDLKHALRKLSAK